MVLGAPNASAQKGKLPTKMADNNILKGSIISVHLFFEHVPTLYSGTININKIMSQLLKS